MPARDPIDDELAFHLEELKRERMEAGDTEAEAIRFARMKLGHITSVREEILNMSPWHRAESLVRHVRFAIRSFRRHGGAYAFGTAILAIGIGLSVAMFSLVEAVVMRPLPFPDQDNIHLIWKTDLQDKSNLVGELAYPELADLEANNAEIQHVALFPAAPYGNGRILQAANQEPVQFETCPASADFFKVLGVAPILGRDFRPGDELAGAEPVVILSNRVWREHFGASRDVISQVVSLNGRGHTVIGVMGADTTFPTGMGLWVPLPKANRRGMIWLKAIARVRPGVTRDALHRAVDRTFQIQLRDYLKEYSVTQRGVVTPISEFLTGSSKSELLISLLASALLLLSACLSAGNLFLSRALLRRREMATRFALGATPKHLLAQFTVESLLVTFIATAAGGLLAAGLIRLLISRAPADIPRIESASLSPPAFLFAAVVALLATSVCGLGPALLLRRKNLDTLLRDGGIRTAGSRSSRRLQHVFLSLQAAVTVAILVVGSLLLLSYRAMLQTDVGFANRDTVTMNLALRGTQFSPESYRRFYGNLLDRLRRAPEVTSAAGVLLRPLEGPIGWDTEYTFEYEQGERDPNQLSKANFEVITPQYFATIGTRILQGRDFDEHDKADSTKVLIVNQSLAGRIRAAGYEPLGQRLRVFGEWRKVAGV